MNETGTKCFCRRALAKVMPAVSLLLVAPAVCALAATSNISPSNKQRDVRGGYTIDTGVPDMPAAPPAGHVAASGQDKELIAGWCSREREIQFGNYVDAFILGKFIVLDNMAVTQAIQRIGERVARSSDRPDLPYHFKVLNANEVNAFAGPGGYIYITTGLLNELESEAEVAAVLAHELGHTAERHVIRQLQNNQNAQVVGALISISATIAIGVAVEDPQLAGDLSNAAGAAAYVGTFIVNRGYSQSYEFKADRLGVEYLERAGYGGDGMARALRKLEIVERKKNANAVHSFLSTHPPIAIRIQKMDDLVTGKKEGA